MLEEKREWLYLESSGSTGAPKSHGFRKPEILASVSISHNFFNYRPGQRVLASLPMDRAGGLMAFARALVHGQHIYTCQAGLSGLIEAMSSVEDLYMTSLVPLQVNGIRSIGKGELLKGIDKVLLGGAPVSQDLENWMQDEGVNAFVGYGMTETLSHIAIRKIGEKMYRALPGVELKEEADRMMLRSAVTGDQFILTDDRVKLEADGSFQWLGRHSRILNSGGIKLQPEAIERRILEHLYSSKQPRELEGRAFYLKGQDDPILGEKLVLCVEGKEFDPAKLLEYLKKLLPTYHSPKEVLFFSQFERTTSGKIKK